MVNSFSMEECVAMKKIPTYIITGFLGSGKTTILQKLLSYCKEHHLTPAVVLNEVGETNVEQHLFKDEHLLEMLNGCICCSIQGDFTKELQLFLMSLPKDKTPDFLFIEGTGIANPMEIVDGLTEPLLIDDIELFSIINLVDSSKYLEYQSIFSSSKEVRTVLKSQVSTSSFILLNKVDLLSKTDLEKVRKKINSLTDAPIVETSFGDVEINELLKRRITVKRSTEKKCGCSHEHSCNEHSHTEPHSFQALKISVNAPIDRIQLEKWLKQLPVTMIRGKGIVQLTETVGKFQFQFASKQLQLKRIQGESNVDPCIILIGTNLKSQEIYESYEKTFTN